MLFAGNIRIICKFLFIFIKNNLNLKATWNTSAKLIDN